MADNPDTAALGAEIERLVGRLDAAGDSPVKAQAQELVRLLLALYGSGLARMLDIVRTEQGGSRATLGRFAADPLVASLLVLHDLHPDPPDVRVARAVGALQPHLPAGLTVHLVSLAGSSAHLRVEGTAAGRGWAAGARVAIERAVREAAPELEAIHIDGCDDRPDPLIQILRRPTPTPAPAES